MSGEELEGLGYATRLQSFIDSHRREIWRLTLRLTLAESELETCKIRERKVCESMRSLADRAGRAIRAFSDKAESISSKARSLAEKAAKIGDFRRESAELRQFCRKLFGEAAALKLENDAKTAEISAKNAQIATLKIQLVSLRNERRAQALRLLGLRQHVERASLDGLLGATERVESWRHRLRPLADRLVAVREEKESRGKLIDAEILELEAKIRGILK